MCLKYIKKKKIKENRVKVFNKIIPFKNTINNIIESELLLDSDIMIYIDSTKNNIYRDKTTDHDLSNNKKFQISKRHIYNKYLFNLGVIKLLLDLNNQNNKINLFFYGTENGDNCKLKEFIISKNDLLETYINYMLNKDITKFSNIDSLKPVIRRTITRVSESNKFTISIIITTGSNKSKSDLVETAKLIISSSNLPVVYICIYIDDKSNDVDFFHNLDKLNYSPNSFIKTINTKIQKFDNFTFISMKDYISHPVISSGLIWEYFGRIFNDLATQFKYIQMPHILNYSPKNIPNILNNSKELYTIKECEEENKEEYKEEYIDGVTFHE
jgi:hypothetical protein